LEGTNTTIQQHGVCQPTDAQALSDKELDTVLWKVDNVLAPSVYLICCCYCYLRDDGAVAIPSLVFPRSIYIYIKVHNLEYFTIILLS